MPVSVPVDAEAPGVGVVGKTVGVVVSPLF